MFSYLNMSKKQILESINRIERFELIAPLIASFLLNFKVMQNFFAFHQILKLFLLNSPTHAHYFHTPHTVNKVDEF